MAGSGANRNTGADCHFETVTLTRPRWLAGFPVYGKRVGDALIAVAAAVAAAVDRRYAGAPTFS